MQANLNCTKIELIFGLPAKTLYPETTEIIIDSLYFLFDHGRVQEEISVIIQPEKDLTESYVLSIDHITKLICADCTHEFE